MDQPLRLDERRSCPMVDVTIVIVTFNRHAYLTRLLASMHRMSCVPRHVVIVDNASSDETQRLIRTHAESGLPGSIINLRQSVNLGGSGGFAAGLSRALQTDTNWFWLMDDDVEVLPDGLEKLLRWSDRYECIHGQRLDGDGSHFFFQPHFNEWLGVPLIWLDRLKGAASFREINVGCFEGMLVSRRVVTAVGLPDARYFQTWDDAIYGWLISLMTPVVLVNEYVLKRTRTQRQIHLVIRHLNDANDTFRYYIMRNRGYVAHLLRQRGRYSGIGFALGTLLVALKEVTRLVLVERRVSGVKVLYRGWRASRRIMRDRDDGHAEPLSLSPDR